VLSVFLEFILFARIIRLVLQINKTFLAKTHNIATLLLKFYLIYSLDLSSLFLFSVLLTTKFSDDMSFSCGSDRLALVLDLRLLSQCVTKFTCLIKDDLLDSVFRVLVSINLVHEVSDHSLVDLHFRMSKEHIEELLQLGGSLFQKLRRRVAEEFLSGKGG